MSWPPASATRWHGHAPGRPFGYQPEQGGALIVQGVGALSLADQARLLRWLDDSCHHTQVVSTTTEPLFPRILRGQFDANLYYRLTVLLLHVDGGEPKAGARRGTADIT